MPCSTCRARCRPPPRKPARLRRRPPPLLAPRRAVIVACLVPALSVGVGYWVQDRTQARNVNYIRSALRIYPPALRLRDARTIDSLFEDSQSLRAEADERRDATEKYVDDGDEYGDAE